MSDQEDNYLELWTVQPKHVWSALQQHGVLYVDESKIEMPEYRTAYQWMNRQFARRISGYQGGLLWWAWTEPPSIDQLDDEKVCIQLGVPKERVLLSSFNDWHFVLNNWFLSLNEQEADEFDERVDEARLRDPHRPESGYPQTFQTEIEQSWERIFDPESDRQDQNWRGHIREQAVLEELRLEWVKKVTGLDILYSAVQTST